MSEGDYSSFSEPSHILQRLYCQLYNVSNELNQYNHLFDELQFEHLGELVRKMEYLLYDSFDAIGRRDKLIKNLESELKDKRADVDRFKAIMEHYHIDLTNVL